VTLDTVPWAISQPGALHSFETARALAYIACDGRTGVAGPTDMSVVAKTIASAQVRVLGGVASIVSTYSNQGGQAYAARNAGEEEVTVPAATTARSDMLVLRINDTKYGGGTPDNAASGPYAKFELISNVGSSATTLPVGLGYPAIALARIDIPANTQAITNAMIKDLRRTVRPASESKNVVVNTNAQGRATINFTTPFLIAPVVTPSGGNGEVYWVTGVTTTGFTFEARSITSPGALVAGGPVRIHYHAVEPH
jgi:hypothetical protein